MGMGATLASEEIYSAFLTDSWDDAFMHGPTFMANPLACAAANASLDLFEREPRAAQVEVIEQQLTQELAACEDLPNVVDVRVKGAIGVVQLAPEVDIYALRPKFLEQNVWIRPFKDVIYLMPPLTIPREELSKLTASIKTVLSS